MKESDELDAQISTAEQAVQLGERTRILFEMLLSTIGFDVIQNPPINDVLKRLVEIQKEYNESIELLTTVMKSKIHAEKGRVSVSN